MLSNLFKSLSNFFILTGEYAKASIINTILFLIIIPVMILGIIVVPLGLFFSHKDADAAKMFSQYNTNRTWLLERLPKFLLWWDNSVDGFRGDTRGWWDFFCEEQVFFGLMPVLRNIAKKIPFVKKTLFPYNRLNSNDYISKVWWGVVRNPANYFKRFVITCDVRECDYFLLAGQEIVNDNDFALQGYHFLKAVHRKTGKSYYRFFLVKAYPGSKKGITAEFGFKFDAPDFKEDYTGREYKAFKGFSYLVSPFKDLT